jgi:pimeloyl-ACP methyl ester carboxylesterase
MKAKRFTEEQIIAEPKEAEAGAKTKDLCRRHGISDATFYNWKAKYAGMTVSEARRLKELSETEVVARTIGMQLKPTWYVVAANDRMIQPDLERKFAKAMNAKTITLPSGHVPMLSHPAEVAKLIIEAARTASTKLPQ